MFNIGFSEMVMIGVLALLLIGPKELPTVARMLGRFLNDLKRSTGSFTDDLKKQVDIDHRKIFDMRQQQNQQGNQQSAQQPNPENPSDEKKS